MRHLARGIGAVRALSITLLIGCLSACGWLTAPLPSGALAFVPPPVYARWWAMTEACSGEAGDFTAVHWYHISGNEFTWQGDLAGGLWLSSGDRIVLADSGVESGPVVRHEMLHALLRTRGHARDQFLGRCASMVECHEACVRDAGRWLAPGRYTLLSPDSFVVSQQITLLPHEADGARWLTVEVSAQNPTSRAVLVATPQDWGIPRGFAFDVRPKGQAGLSIEQPAHDSSRIYFAPKETKRWLYEFRVTSFLDGSHVPSGLIRLHTAYARHWTPIDSVLVSP
jgi:hypothetical protein